MHVPTLHSSLPAHFAPLPPSLQLPLVQMFELQSLGAPQGDPLPPLSQRCATQCPLLQSSSCSHRPPSMGLMGRQVFVPGSQAKRLLSGAGAQPTSLEQVVPARLRQAVAVVLHEPLRHCTSAAHSV